MIESITLAEFHDTEGSKCVLKYPSSLISDNIALENFILPEGLHNHIQDSSIALIRRPRKVIIETHPKFKVLSELKYKVDFFKYTDEWIQVSPVSNEGCALNIVKKYSKFFFEVNHESSILVQIELHKDIQFTILTDTFASLYTVDGKALGLLFKNNSLKDFDNFIRFVLEDDLTELEKKVFGYSILYCFSICRIKPIEGSSRGVQIMGLGIISPSKYVVNLDTAFIIALDKIMENPKKAARVLKKLHKTINSAPWPNNLLSQTSKKLLKTCLDRGFQTESSQTVEFEYEGVKIFSELSETLLDEELIEVSLKKLFDIFQENLIKIFTCLILEKRIIIYAKNKPCHFICNMTISVCRLISPPIPYIFSQHLYPFVTLSDLEFLNGSFYIAGANNPLFKHREQWWDLLADLDTGEVITNIQPPKLFSEFIQNIQQNIQFEPNPELFIKSQFYDFTQHILDSHLHSQIFENFDNNLIHLNIKGELSLQYTSIQNKARPTGFEEISASLLKLRLMHITEKVESIEKVYKDLYEHIKKDEEKLKFFLSLLPNCGDLHCIAAGFFLDNVKAWRFCCKILTVIENLPQGQHLVMLLQPSELNAYIAYKNRL